MASNCEFAGRYAFLLATEAVARTLKPGRHALVLILQLRSQARAGAEPSSPSVAPVRAAVLGFPRGIFRSIRVKASELLKPASPEEAVLLNKLNTRLLPHHVAIIMDGNGRWAERRHLPRIAGHRAGVRTARETIETCAKLKIPALTLYAFSLENWRRPQTETDFLMRLLREYLKREMPRIHRNNIRFLIIGRAELLPDAVRKDVNAAMQLTAKNTGMKLVVALNYGGRAELVDAFNSILERVQRTGQTAFTADEKTISDHLYTAGLPDPDLLIRTSGEMRLSNFLLWQVAYAELYITDILWPDFVRMRLLESLVEFQQRERRYGGLAAQRGRTRSSDD
jgi:undecaprenyl diphosphate synthase